MTSWLIAQHNWVTRQQQSISYEKENQNDSSSYLFLNVTGIHNAFIHHILKTEANTEP